MKLQPLESEREYMPSHVLSGIDTLMQNPAILQGRRVGLMTNPTGVNHNLQSTIDLLQSCCRLTALFAVEHGIRGDHQAGANVGDTIDEKTGIPVFSAYGDHAHFTQEMLDAFDVLVFDIQDIGARFYTYIYSLAYAMESCANAQKAVVVLDRVNPLGGIRRCGTILDARFASFVGDYALPTRYGLTIGEFAKYVKDFLSLSLDLTVVPLAGWSREMLLDDTDLPWVATSPNLPDLQTALCYIGTCIFEGTNLSEGRGTTQPFQLIGAPFLQGDRLADAMNALDLPGLRFRPVSFCPTFSKFQGECCHGVQMHIMDRNRADTFLAGLQLLDVIRAQAGDQFAFLQAQDHASFFIDKLLGTDLYRKGNLNGPELAKAHREGVESFSRKVQSYEIYK